MNIHTKRFLNSALLVSGMAFAPAALGSDLPAKADIEARLGLHDSHPFTLSTPFVSGDSVVVTVPLEGGLTLELDPYSIRAAGYVVYESRADGSLVERAPSPVNTLRGVVSGDANSRVTGGIVDGGLHVMIARDDMERLWIEPLAHHFPGSPEAYVAYTDGDVDPVEGQCDMSHAARGGLDDLGADVHGSGGSPTSGLQLCFTELACDADFAYFQDWGGGTEGRINLVINSMNSQYESQVDITHTITAIIIRTTQVYTTNDAFALLSQFRSRWLNQHGGIQRDVAKLFTGRNINGGTIGIAWGLGEICTSGAYCLSQSDFNGSFTCATDLAAHELGHLWNGFHCSCPSFTMNPSITCANEFSSATIGSIVNHRNSRPCLDCVEPGACCLADGTCGVIAEEACAALGGIYQGEGSTCPGTCSETSACCLSGVCFDSTGPFCASVGGEFFDGEDCTSNPCGPTCVHDLDGDTIVGFGDLLALLAAWGPCPGCPADFDGDDQVAFSDLLALLAAWGPCA